MSCASSHVFTVFVSRAILSYVVTFILFYLSCVNSHVFNVFVSCVIVILCRCLYCFVCLVLDLLQVARLMRMRPLDTDTVGARSLEKQNGGGSRNKRLVSPAARPF